MKLYTYFRSSAAYRVRIALNLKGLPYEAVPVHLVKGGGEHLKDDYRAINPSALVPSLQDEGATHHAVDGDPRIPGRDASGAAAAAVRAAERARGCASWRR